MGVKACACVIAALAGCAHDVASPNYSVNFVPFGAGQFQNDDASKGTAFAIAEGATAATSIGIWLYLDEHYRGREDEVPIADVSRVQTLERVEIGTGIAFFTLYSLGVVDALFHFRRSVRVAPIVLPGGGGAALSWSR
jgi:hypothetical protein